MFRCEDWNFEIIYFGAMTVTNDAGSTSVARVLANLEASEPVVVLEGASVIASPFSKAQLEAETGHEPEFLGSGALAPLPDLKHPEDIAARRDKLIRWLDYRHFSILFDARKKQALATIVDIDGEKFEPIKRTKGDKWYHDPRLATEDQPQARHFSKPDPRIDPDKNHFAFGHLVRRLDPCWNPKRAKGAAKIGELQSFFLTNASPQAEDLNEGIWNNLEDLVLNDLTQRLKVRAVVISGPLFDDVERRRIHDEMPVASQYFKIVAWKSDDRLVSVGWVQRQPPDLLPPIVAEALPFEEPDKKGKTKASLMWLRPISEIAAMANLDLSAYEAGDTYSLRKPRVSLETVVASESADIFNADDLLLTGVLPLDDAEARSPIVGVTRPMLAYREQEEGDPRSGTAPSASAVLESISASRASEKACNLIVEYETGGRAYYENHYKKRPVWPKEASGITIGFGYDLGYVSKDEFERDWAQLPSDDLALLATTLGMRGKKNSDDDMKAALAKVKRVVIEWELAETVFRKATLPKFETLTSEALPNVAMLSGDSFGALVSLTFNRGAAYSRQPKHEEQDRWVQMRAIRQAMHDRRFEKIPALIIAMIPLWKGTDIEKGMTRRRTDEAALFLGGLSASPLPESLEARIEAESAEPLDDAERWPDQTEEDIAQAEAAGPVITLEASGVSWGADVESADYAHLKQPPGIGLSFSLVAADLELLAKLNDFALDQAGERVLFGLRGAMIVTDHTSASGITLKDLRPDHETPRCVLGVWDRAAGTVSVFPGSTVPNSAAVRRWRASRDMGNLLATGCYGYVAGTHNGKPGCLLLRETIAKRRKVVVRRSSEDLTYDLSDLADPCAPGDNIHPTFRLNMSSFSSVGCQTVVGMATVGGDHSGPWAKFRMAAGLPKSDGTPFVYMLLTGAEARLASGLRRNGLADDPVSLAGLSRLRFGSNGEAVKRLQRKLGIESPDGDFGPTTAMRLHERQRSFPGASGSDGIYTRELDVALGWAVLQA